MPIPNRLRDLIRNIRSCKTAAEERALVQKECADIRNGFREEDVVFRCRNVAKLLYIYMLGYPAHFGQMETLKLIVSGRFTDKRIGYLGAMLLLDENREVHIMMTNSLKSDMENSSQYIQSLALCTLGNVCSTEMARDLAPDVEKLMKNSNSYIKKKAILCACRIVRKSPELMENFIPLTKPSLTDKNHGVMLAGTALITEMCRKSSQVHSTFRKWVPILVRTLKNLIMAGYTPEHDVNGISDPFLQVLIIRLLRILGKNNDSASESMNDILAQVATNTETSKNVGNAILYETVLTIMDINSESGLRVLAVNILGRFLLNNDKNIRYVALNSLLKTVHTDMNAVQRHRTTVLDCLKDPDPSILKRAMELCFALINSNNVRGTMRELLSFLSRCPSEFKSDCSNGILLAAEKFAPNNKWHIDTILKVLTTAGNHVRDDAVPRLIHLISSSTTMHSYAVQHLYHALITTDDLNIQPLSRVTSWCLGEYGGEIHSDLEDGDNIKISENDVLTILEKILISSMATTITKSYAINAIMKLSTRYPTLTNDVQRIVSEHSTSHNMEVQQRSVEYTTLFGKHNNLRPGVLEPMPQFERPGGDAPKTDDETPTEAAPNSGAAAPDLIDTSLASAAPAPVAPAAPAAQSNVDLLLMELTSDPVAPTSQPSIQQPSSSLGGGLDDLLSSTINQPSVVAPVTNGHTTNNTMDLLGGMMSTPVETPSMAPPAGIVAYNKDDIEIKFEFQRAPQSVVLTVNLTAVNSSVADVTNFVFQAAVPKSLQLQLLTPSGNTIGANRSSAVTQTFKIKNPNKTQLRLRVRVQYTRNGENFEQMQEVNNFPASTWQ